MISQRCSIFLAACCLVATYVVESPGYAQGNQQPGPAFSPNSLLITPNYRDADIRAVAEQLAQVLGRPIVIDPRVRAQVTVLSNAPMSPDAFYGLFLSVLKVRGLVALESSDAIRVVPED
jgi:general secretion pathway protein D